MGLKCCSFFSFEWKSEIGREKSQRKIKDEHGDFQAQMDKEVENFNIGLAKNMMLDKMGDTFKEVKVV